MGNRFRERDRLDDEASALPLKRLRNAGLHHTIRVRFALVAAQEKVSEASNPAYQNEVADLSQKLKSHLTQQFQIAQKYNGVAAYYQKNQKQ